MVKAACAKDRLERLRWDFSAISAVNMLVLESRRVPEEIRVAFSFLKEMSEDVCAKIPDDLHRSPGE